MEDERPFKPDELRQLQENIARLSDESVRRLYREAWKDCEMKGERLPRAKALQQLVQAWKQLWKWR